MARKIKVEIAGDASSLERAFSRSSRAGQRWSASLGTFAKGALVFEGVRRGIDAASGAVRAGIGEWSQQQKVAAQTTAAIRSTGGVANVTARHVERLGTHIQNLSGLDDEAIKSGANLLLTFKQVRNEIGKGNQVFDRATQAAVDLSVAGFGSLDSTAKQLGKALNDPIRGMTALGRAGVTFTDRQKETIRALVETGKTLEAQKLILREVESQVGGSAKAYGDTLPGQLNKLREAFRNVFGDLVGAVAKPLGRVAASLAAVIPRVQETVSRLSATVTPAIEAFIGAFTRRLPELQRILSSIVDPLRTHVVPILLDIAQIVRRTWDNLVAVFSRRSGDLQQILSNLGEILRNVWTVARPTIVFLFEKVLPAALNIAIPLLVKITGAARVMAQVFVRVVGTIVKALDLFLGGLSALTDAASHLPFIGDKFKGVSDKVNASRDALRGFNDDLEALDGKTVAVTVETRMRVIGDAGKGARGAGRGPSVPSSTSTAAADKAAAAADSAVRAAEKATKGVSSAAEAQTKAADSQKEAAEAQKKAADKAKEAAEAAARRFAEARSSAKSLFGPLFQLTATAGEPATFLGGTRGHKLVPTATTDTAAGLLRVLTAQNAAFRQTQRDIARLAKRGAPERLLDAVRSGEVSAQQAHVLASANQAVLSRIFRQIRISGSLITRAAKMDVHSPSVTIRTPRLVLAPSAAEHGRGGRPIVVENYVYLDGREIEENQARRAKRRGNQRTGRAGGHR